MRKRRKFGKKNITSGRGVTFEQDKTFIYAKKLMPRRKKRRWKSFVRKVHAAAERELGSRTVLFNAGYSFSNTVPFEQGLATFCLYGRESSSVWLDDIRYLGELENVGNPTALDGNRVADNGKIMFQSAVLDLTMRNISAKDGNLDLDCTLEVDIYEISIGKDTVLGPNHFDSVQDLLDSNNTLGIYDQSSGSVGTEIRLRQRGCTPFEKTKALSEFRVKIWKKTKYFLKPGQTLTYQTRDPKRHTLYKNEMLKADEGFNWPGVTKSILVIYKSVPGIVVGSLAGETQEQLTVGVTRKYLYKVEGLQEDRSIRVIR